jgi:hypothetical protein
VRLIRIRRQTQPQPAWLLVHLLIRMKREQKDRLFS